MLFDTTFLARKEVVSSSGQTSMVFVPDSPFLEAMWRMFGCASRGNKKDTTDFLTSGIYVNYSIQKIHLKLKVTSEMMMLMLKVSHLQRLFLMSSRLPRRLARAYTLPSL